MFKNFAIAASVGLNFLLLLAFPAAEATRQDTELGQTPLPYSCTYSGTAQDSTYLPYAAGLQG